MMADLLKVADLEAAKKHDTFHTEVITGKVNGVDSDYATNAVTGQVQKTLPATVNGIDWSYVGKFADGVTFTKKTDFAVDSVGTQWIYTGSLPFTATAGTVPSEPAYQVVHVTDVLYAGDTNLYRRHVTIAQLAAGDVSVGGRVYVIELNNAPFDVVSGGTANGYNIRDAGNGNTAVYQLIDGVANVKHLGGKTGVDSTGAFIAACGLSNQVHFPDDDVYEVDFGAITGNASLVTFTDEPFVYITGANATVKDVSTYSEDYLTDLIKFVRCGMIVVTVNFDANPLANIAAPSPFGLGYAGSSALYFEENCKGIFVKNKMSNVRYGVRSGSYSDPSKGGCSHFDLDIVAESVGYPCALYLADDIRVNIKSNVQHRAAYFAGCSNVRGTVTYDGFTYAAISVLFTTSVTVNAVLDADRRADGCSNVKINIVDEGSTGTQSNRAMSGLAYQWVAPDTKFSDVHINLYTKTSDANRTLGGFRLENTAGVGGTTGWLPTNRYDNIKISGVIDREAQTLSASSWADISIQATQDGDVEPYTTSPVFDNLDLSDFKVINGGATGNINRVETPRAFGIISLKNLHSAGSIWRVVAPSAVIDGTNMIIGSASFSDLKYPRSQDGSDGYRFNSDGTLEQWMLVNYNVTENTDQTFNFPIVFPRAAWSPSVDVVGITGRTWSVTGLTTTGITVRCSATNVSLYIKVIGK
jgi:hypothetical protein